MNLRPAELETVRPQSDRGAPNNSRDVRVAATNAIERFKFLASAAATVRRGVTAVPHCQKLSTLGRDSDECGNIGSSIDDSWELAVRPPR